MKCCPNCLKSVNDNAKFCTFCGAEMILPVKGKVEVIICRCGAVIRQGAKFCTQCGIAIAQSAGESVSGQAGICKCGSLLNPDAKFCTVCGKKIEIAGNADLDACSCGAPLLPGARFCVVCGAPRLMDQSVQNNQINKEDVPRSKKRSFRIAIAAAIMAVVLAGAYFLFLYNPGIKKTLLATYEIIPNDTSETVIQYNDEVSISIPAGQIKVRDTLNLYSVENVDKPEFADDVVRTYDFDFSKTKSFKEEVEVSFTLSKDISENRISAGQSVYVMYYNEESGQWEDTDAIINKKNNTIRVSRSHFSCLGLVSHSTLSGPMMRATAMVDPASMNIAPDFSQAERTLNYYINNKVPSAGTYGEGIDFFLKSYEITTLSTGVHEDVLKYPSFSTFNKLAGNLGLLKAFVSCGIELGRNQYLDAVLHLGKELIMFKLGTLGWQAVAIYNVAKFLYDVHQEQVAAESHAAVEQEYRNEYYHYNATQNPYRKSGAEWTKYINDNISRLIDFEWQLNQEVEKYVRSFFDVRSDIPEDMKQSLIDMERNRMNGVIQDAVKRYLEDLRKKQEQDIIDQLAEMKKVMNSVITINVNVYGKEEGSKAARGLPVKIVVDKDQELWAGSTDRAGQFVFNCTWLGYMAYGSPQKAEVEYEGSTYAGNISIDKSNMAIVRIYIDEKSEDEEPADTEESFSFSTIAGKYVAYCNDYENYIKDETGQFIQSIGTNKDEYSDHYLEIIVNANGSASISVTSPGNCNPKESGKTQFVLNKSNLPEASVILTYSDNCPPVDNATQKMHDMFLNGSYTAKIEYDKGIMKVQYTEIITLGTEIKAVLFFDCVKQ